MSEPEELLQLVRDSYPPSFFVRETQSPWHWGTVTVCKGCGLRGARADQHPVHPCKRCGDRVEERVGRWVDLYREWWKFWEPRRGFWAVKT